jgi:paraquat-inducible protein B
VADVQKTVGSARGALERAESMLVSFDGAMADDSPLGWQINTTLQEVSALARAFRKLTDYLERYPDSMIFGKKPGGGGQ